MRVSKYVCRIRYEDVSTYIAKTLQILQGDFDSLRQMLTCKICERLYYEPYVLACGHTYCYSCLSTWFTANRKKPCPNCRVPTKEQPAPSYVIKDMVHLFVLRSELLPDGETREQHLQWQQEEAEIVQRDRDNGDAPGGGLFKGVFNKRRGIPHAPVYDPEDNVDRCPRCHWELEDDMCQRCGIHVGNSDTDSDTDSFIHGHDLDGELDEDLDIQDDDSIFEGSMDAEELARVMALYGHEAHRTDSSSPWDDRDSDAGVADIEGRERAAASRRNWYENEAALWGDETIDAAYRFPRHHDDEDLDEDDEDEDEDEDSFESSFIDDHEIEEDSGSDEVADEIEGHLQHNSDDTSETVGQASDSSPVTTFARPISQDPTHRRARIAIMSSDDEQEEGNITHAPRRRRAVRSVVSSGEEEESESDGDMPNDERAEFSPLGNTLCQSTSEEESEDEAPVRPGRIRRVHER